MQTLSSDPIVHSPTDRVLLAEFIDGRSTEAFAELMRRHAGMVVAVCQRRLGRISESEDAAQAVFILMWQQSNKLAQHSSVVGWLHTTAYNVCRNIQRAQAVRSKHEREAGRLANQSTEFSEADWLAVREILDNEIGKLPTKLRIPLILFHLEGRGLNEVAAELNTSVSTVGTWLARAREALAGKLKRYGIAIGSVALGGLLNERANAAEIRNGLIDDTIQLAVNCMLDGASEAGRSIAGLVQEDATTNWLFSKSMLTLAAALSSIIALAVFLMWPVFDTWLSPDYPLLQGTWKEISEERDGRPYQVENPVEHTNWLVISGRGFRRVQELPNGKRIVSESGAILLGNDGEQKAIDFRLWQGSVLGIYRLENDQLTLCVGEPVQIGQRDTPASRPDDFVTAKGDSRRLTIYEKVE